MSDIGKTAADGTYSQYGAEGLVQMADGTVQEADPSRNADGTVVAGFESDERTMEDRARPEGDLRPADDTAVNEHEQRKADEINAANADAPLWDDQALGTETADTAPATKAKPTGSKTSK
jgi:hypothetical protein